MGGRIRKCCRVIDEYILERFLFTGDSGRVFIEVVHHVRTFSNIEILTCYFVSGRFRVLIRIGGRCSLSRRILLRHIGVLQNRSCTLVIGSE